MIGEIFLQLFIGQSKPNETSMIGFSAKNDIFGGRILGRFFRKRNFIIKNDVFGKVNIPLCSADHQLFNDTMIVKIGFN